MRKLLHAIAGTFLLAGVPVQAQGTLAAEREDGFITGYTQGNGEASITEEVPAGETVERWTRMITTQYFAGLARQRTPPAFLAMIGDSAARGCAGASVSPITETTVGGRPAARIRVDCPLNSQTGLPETFWAIAVAGSIDMHVRQVAFRKTPDAADTAWAERVLMRIRWCPAAATC